MREEIKVVRVEAVPGENIMKSAGTKRFVGAIQYVLENGRTIKSVYSADRKKDVVTYLGKLPREPKDMKVSFYGEENKLFSVSESMSSMMGW